MQILKHFSAVFLLSILSATPVHAQSTPSVSLNSFLKYDVYKDGKIAIEQTDLAFAPASLNAKIVIRKAAGGKVAEHKFYEDYRVKVAVFGRMMPAQSPVEKLAVGDYVVDYYVGGSVVTSIPFSVKPGITSSDPFNPGSTFKFVGPWQKWGYLAPHTRSANSAAAIYFWAGANDLPAGARAKGYTAKAYRNGRLIAHSNPRTGHLGATWMGNQRAFFQVPHATNKSHNARNVMLAELSKPGNYRIDVVMNDSGKVIRSFSYKAAGGKITPHARTKMGHQPQADYIFPRATVVNSSSYEWHEVHWIEG